MEQVSIGDRVREIITGYIGICIARTEYLFGCVRVQLQAETLHEGKPTESIHCDEGSCEVMKRAALVPTQEPKVATGGPREDTRAPLATVK